MGQPIVGGLLVVAAILAAGAGDGPRVWTDRYGNTTTAKFVRVFGGNVVLLRGGKTMTVPLGNLCDEDQELARRLQTGLPVEEDSGARNALRPRAAETGDASETEPWNRGVSPQADVSIGADEDSASPWATMPVRTWTDFQHREIEASFAGVRGKNVCLRKDGKTLLFPYGFFSAQDRLYVQTALKEAGQEDRIAALTGVEPNPRHGAMTGTEMPTSPWFAPDPSPTNIPPAADPLDEWRNEVTQEAERWQREREEAARRQREEAERRAQQWNAQPDTVFPAAPPVTQRIVHYCTKCGGELPSTVKTGDICPHCKARLVSFTGNSNQPFHAQALPAQAAPTLPIWLKIGGGLILVVLALGAAVVALKLLGDRERRQLEHPFLLVVKTGSTMPALAHRFGDFEHWILRGMDWPAEASRVVDVAGGEKLPSAGTPSAVAITGSHAMVSERLPWSEYTARWLAGAASRGVPILGICYGHQLLAHALGGIVDNNPSGREFGTVTIRMTDQAEGDPLLGIFRPAAPVHVCHTQAVLKLPPGAKLLASSQRDPHQAFVVGNCAWGVQFHPEFSTEVVAEYIRAHEAALRSEGQDPAWLLQTLSPNALGAGLLQRFAQIVRQRAG